MASCALDAECGRFSNCRDIIYIRIYRKVATTKVKVTMDGSALVMFLVFETHTLCMDASAEELD